MLQECAKNILPIGDKINACFKRHAAARRPLLRRLKKRKAEQTRRKRTACIPSPRHPGCRLCTQKGGGLYTDLVYSFRIVSFAYSITTTTIAPYARCQRWKTSSSRMRHAEYRGTGASSRREGRQAGEMAMGAINPILVRVFDLYYRLKCISVAENGNRGNL